MAIWFRLSTSDAMLVNAAPGSNYPVVSSLAFWTLRTSNPAVTCAWFWAAGPSGSHSLQYVNASVTYQFSVAFTAGTGSWQIPAPPLNTWVHIGVAYDGRSTANAPEIYQNGVRQDLTVASVASGSMRTNHNAWWFGNSSARNAPWAGLLAEGALWRNRLLTGPEFRRLAGGDSPAFLPSQLLVYRPMSPLTSAGVGAQWRPSGVWHQAPHPPIRYPRLAASAVLATAAGHGPLLAGARNHLVLA